MTAPSSANPLSDLNQVLSEAIDMLEEVKQADWKVPGTHPLHGELDRLVTDLVAWNTELSDRDHALGVSALSFMPSLVTRTPPNLWPGDPTDAAVCALVDDHLRRLEAHAVRVRGEHLDDGVLSVLDELKRGIDEHRRVLLRIAQDPTILNS